MLDVAFVRSPMAHAVLGQIIKPRGKEDRVFTAEDLAGVRPIRAVSALKGFKVSEQPVLATGKVRQVGELVAMCVAPTRAQAEDLADDVEVGLEELPAVVDMVQARTNPPALVHEHWGDNVFLESLVDDDIASIEKKARVRVRRSIRTARQHMSPLEGRGVVCEWHKRLGQLVMYSAAQMPHLNRAGLAECLGIDQGAIRVIAPDVGGGFGYKGILLPEEVCLAWLCRKLGRPGALDRGPARAALRRRQLSGAPLRHHGLCRRQRAPARDRLRSHRGFGCVLVVSVLRVPRSRASELDPARTLQDGALPMPHLVGSDEQGADPSVPRRRADGRLLRARADDRRSGARARHGAARRPPREPRAAVGNAVRQHYEEALSTAAITRRPCGARRR
jgi:DNA-binding transcriptional ArsR family regulator